MQLIMISGHALFRYMTLPIVDKNISDNEY